MVNFKINFCHVPGSFSATVCNNASIAVRVKGLNSFQKYPSLQNFYFFSDSHSECTNIVLYQYVCISKHFLEMHNSISVDALMFHQGMEEIHWLCLSKLHRQQHKLLSYGVSNENMVQELSLQAFFKEVQQVS